MPSIKPKRLVAILLRFGFVFDRQRGSHATYVHLNGNRATIPMHPGDIPPGTLRGILGDAGLKPEDIR